MTHEKAQEIATHNGLGEVHFQFNIARNTGKEFEVGYVVVQGQQVLFCKRQSYSLVNEFYLCNEFRGMDTVTLGGLST
jgi:hypothetical protein